MSVAGKLSSELQIQIGTPQGSRLSPLLFICLMADMNLWINESSLSNFADDTQSIIVAKDQNTAIEVTKREANSIIDYFSSNDLVNNPDKACLVYNSRGKGEKITISDIGGEELESLDPKKSERLLGLQLSPHLNWDEHVSEISVVLNKRMGLLRRIKKRVPTDKLLIVAENIFNAKIRYGIAVYLQPTFEKEDVKAQKLSANTKSLQTLQNTMLRTVFGFRQEKQVNMTRLRERIKMMSVNQMNVYHVLLEVFNVLHNGSSEQIRKKWMDKGTAEYPLRNKEKELKVPERPSKKCIGFTYCGAKLYNILPDHIKDITKPEPYKTKIKEWIWNTIPPY